MTVLQAAGKELFDLSVTHSSRNPLVTFLCRPFNSVVVGVIGIALVFALDIFTGREISFSIFYIPWIAYIAWCAGFPFALAAAVTGGACWYVADLETGNIYSNRAIPIWNAIMRTLIFSTVAFMLARLKISVQRESAARIVAHNATLAKSDFLSTMSHEIRTPLNAMIGAADILAETPLTSEQAEYVSIFRGEGEQARRLLNDILDYSKIEASRLQLEQTPFDLAALLKAATQSIEPLCREKNLTLSRVIDPHFHPIRLGDPYRFRQILTNLLNNAVKFTSQGGITVRLASSPSSGVRLSVEDTGIGIPLDQQSTIFGRFNQATTSTTRQFGGSGLGLSITKGLVDAMGGTIRFDSLPGRGTCFHLEIPLPPASLPDQTTNADPKNQNLDRPLPSRPLRVLLVDDYEYNRKIISRFLHRQPLQVDLAENGRIALEKLPTAPYDLLLLDMHMPEVDGWTVAREVRAREKQAAAPSLPIIALTASALKEDEDRCLEAGCTAFLGKPIRKQDLLRQIERVLNIQLSVDLQPEPNHPTHQVDPELAVLVPGFLNEVASLCDTLISDSGRDSFSTAADTAHKLIGMGGSYGFLHVSEIARRIEAAAERKLPLEIAALAGQLKSYIHRVQKEYE